MAHIFIAYIDFATEQEVDAIASTEYEPSEVLQRKINALADMLDCTPEEAEQILFGRL